MSHTIQRHPDAATLMSYAAGTLPEPLAAVIAAHASLCPACAREIGRLERLGALLLATEPARSEHQLGVPPRPTEPALRQGTAAAAPPAAGGLPAPLARRYGLALADVPWRRMAPGIWHHRLALSPGATGDLRLLKVEPGVAIPEHGHSGLELTLVLEGAFSDATGRFGPGEVQDLDQDSEHLPVADAARGCICVIASEGRVRFKSLVGRLIGPLHGV
jgi:putative transcriptional regulator